MRGLLKLIFFFFRISYIYHGKNQNKCIDEHFGRCLVCRIQSFFIILLLWKFLNLKYVIYTQVLLGISLNKEIMRLSLERDNLNLFLKHKKLLQKEKKELEKMGKRRHLHSPLDLIEVVEKENVPST